MNHSSVSRCHRQKDSCPEVTVAIRQTVPQIERCFPSPQRPGTLAAGPCLPARSLLRFQHQHENLTVLDGKQPGVGTLAFVRCRAPQSEEWQPRLPCARESEVKYGILTFELNFGIMYYLRCVRTVTADTHLGLRKRCVYLQYVWAVHTRKVQKRNTAQSSMTTAATVATARAPSKRKGKGEKPGVSLLLGKGEGGEAKSW